MFKLKRPSHVFTDNWSVLLKTIDIHKKINFGLVGVITILLGIIIYNETKSPLVITLTPSKTSTYYFAKRENISIKNDDIGNLMRKFVYLRYRWESLRPKIITDGLYGIVTEDFEKMTYKYLTALKNKDFKDQKLSQDISHLKIVATKEKVEAYFDKVLKINGVGLIIPTKVNFRLKVGAKNRINPRGLYIYKVIETTGGH